jgi:flagellar FliJ protein
MSADVQSLQTLLGHAEQERDAAQAALRQAEEAEGRARAQQEQLAQYRAEYHQRWGDRFAQSGTAQLLQCHHGFGQRLDQAIEQQARQVAGLAQRREQARALLLQREQRLAAVRKLIERRLAAARQIAERRDQKRSDEAAQRAAWAARTANP